MLWVIDQMNFLPVLHMTTCKWLLEQLTSLHKLWLHFVLRLLTARHEDHFLILIMLLTLIQNQTFRDRDVQTHNFQTHAVPYIMLCFVFVVHSLKTFVNGICLSLHLYINGSKSLLLQCHLIVYILHLWIKYVISLRKEKSQMGQSCHLLITRWNTLQAMWELENILETCCGCLDKAINHILEMMTVRNFS